jgi:hypothetical protein
MQVKKLTYEYWNQLPNGGENIRLEVTLDPDEDSRDVLQSLRIWAEQQTARTPKEMLDKTTPTEGIPTYEPPTDL